MKNIEWEPVKSEVFRVYRKITEEMLPKDLPLYVKDKLIFGTFRPDANHIVKQREGFKPVVVRKSVFYVTRAVTNDGCYYERFTRNAPSYSPIGGLESKTWFLKGHISGSSFQNYQMTLLAQGWKVILVKEVKPKSRRHNNDFPRSFKIERSTEFLTQKELKARVILEQNDKFFDEFYNIPRKTKESDMDYPPLPEPPPLSKMAQFVRDRKTHYEDKNFGLPPSTTEPEKKSELKAFVQSRLSPTFSKKETGITRTPEEQNMTIKEIVKYRLSLKEPKEKGKTKNE